MQEEAKHNREPENPTDRKESSSRKKSMKTNEFSIYL